MPWHSHDDRPALIYVAIGEVTEYASNCAGADRAPSGEVTEEMKGTSHWWKNTGKTTAVLLSADLLRKRSDAHTCDAASHLRAPTPGSRGRASALLPPDPEPADDHDDHIRRTEPAMAEAHGHGACGAIW